jgi:predicted nucleic acid-binding protein
LIVVADAGPIIHLSLIGHLDLIPALFGRVVVPRRVYEEVVRSEGGMPGSDELRNATWADLHEGDVRPELVRLLESHLDFGEAAAIALALDLGADMVLSDDRQARLAAERLELRVRGTLGILLEARRQGRIPELAPLLNELRSKGVWLSGKLIEGVLREAGEAVQAVEE